MATSCTFSVPFMAGQGRPRISKRGRKVWLRKPAKDRDLERIIADAYREAGGTMAPDRQPVAVCIRTTRNVRTDMRKRDGIMQVDVDKPDADNIAKLVLDALNGIAYRDDAQVDYLSVIKCQRVRGQKPKTFVTVVWEDDEDGEHAPAD